MAHPKDVVPATDKSAFKCVDPCCGAYAHQHWHSVHAHASGELPALGEAQTHEVREALSNPVRAVNGGETVDRSAGLDFAQAPVEFVKDCTNLGRELAHRQAVCVRVSKVRERGALDGERAHLACNIAGSGAESRPAR